MTIGSLPPASIYGTWTENIELRSIDDDALADLSGLIEITLRLRDPQFKHDELILTMSRGDIVIPSPGIIQWRVEAGTMGVLIPKLYEVILLLKDADTTLVMVLGPISIVE